MISMTLIYITLFHLSITHKNKNWRQRKPIFNLNPSFWVTHGPIDNSTLTERRTATSIGSCSTWTGSGDRQQQTNLHSTNAQSLHPPSGVPTYAYLKQSGYSRHTDSSEAAHRRALLAFADWVGNNARTSHRLTPRRRKLLGRGR